MNNTYVIGVDIGGTNIKSALLDGGGRIVRQTIIPLQFGADGKAEWGNMVSALRQLIGSREDRAKIAGIGVASPGTLDEEEGIVQFAVNLNWEQFHLKDCLERELNLPVVLCSDAVAGAIGEKEFGHAADLDHFLFVSIGTGIGASLFQRNAFYRGQHGYAINLGHTTIDPQGEPCGCGGRGCLEKDVSLPGLIRHVEENRLHNVTLLNDWIREGKRLEGKLVYDAAHAGDEFSIRMFEYLGEKLAPALGNCIQLFDIGNVVVGGGLSAAFSYLIAPITAQNADPDSPNPMRHVRFRAAKHPTMAGTLGAAANFRAKSKDRSQVHVLKNGGT